MASWQKCQKRLIRLKPQRKMKRFPSKQKAIDLAIWQNHSYQFKEYSGVVLSTQGDYLVVPKPHPTFEVEEYEELLHDYSKMSYRHIQQIRIDDNPLKHWEYIAGSIAVLDGELLRFIISAKVPLKRFIRYELACRGYDKDMKWVGFNKAQEIWLK